MQITLAGATLGDLAAKGKLAQNAEPTKGFPIKTDGFIAEPKYDGWRIIAVVGHDRVNFYSRAGKTYNVLPKIEAELLAALPAGTVLDGEAVALAVEDGKVVKTWGKTQSLLTTHGANTDKVTYMIFDLLAHRGIDARSLAFDKRRALLERVFESHSFERVALTVQCPATPDAYDVLLKQGFEGAVLKRLNAPYATNKRGHGWIKVKPVASIDAVVMGFKPGESGFKGMVGAVVFGQHNDDGVLVERGRCSGMDMRTRLDMTHHPEKWIGRVIEVKHEGVSIGSSDSGRFRFPRVTRVRADKSPEQVGFHDE